MGVVLAAKYLVGFYFAALALFRLSLRYETQSNNRGKSYTQQHHHW